jgi:hypothetical protein
MSSTHPKLLSSELSDQVNDFIVDVTHIGKYNKLVFSRLMASLDELQKTDVVSANAMQALIFGIVGNYERADACLLNAERNFGHDQAGQTRVAILANQVRASEAFVAATKALKQKGAVPLMDIGEAACSVGAFRIVRDAIDVALQNKEQLAMTTYVHTVRAAVKVLDQANVPDEVVAKVIDVAGELVRERGLLWMNDKPDVLVVPPELGGPVLQMVYHVWVSPEESAHMNWELFERLDDLDLIFPGFQVSFVGEAEAQEPAHALA